MVRKSYIKELLIADDDADDQFILKEVIHEFSKGIETKTVFNGNELMEILKKISLPDLVFLDLNMPMKDGFQCLSEMRSNDKYKSLPVIVFSTSNNDKDIDFCFEKGAEMFCTKPWSMDGYKELIHSLLMVDWKKFTRPATKAEFINIATRNRGLLHS
jgi:CheY-like chemotaxis protein